MTKRLFEIDPWVVSTTQFDADDIRLIESITSMGNGHMGSRGNFEEGFGGDSHLGTYIAGVWFPDKTRVGWWKNGYPNYFGKVINAINFLAIDIAVDGETLDLAGAEPEAFVLTLDLRRGVLTREVTCEVGGSRILIRFERFLSIVEPELSYQRVTIEMLAGGGRVEFTPKLDGDVRNIDSNYGERFWNETGRTTEPASLSVRTIANPFGTPQFTVTAMMRAAVVGLERERLVSGDLMVGEQYAAVLAPGQGATLEKTVAVLTSRDHPDVDHVALATELLDRSGSRSFDTHELEQAEAWAGRWRLADVEIHGDDAAQQGIRFNIFQLLSTYYGEDDRLNIGPKGFTGEKYGGATYWDTEAYLVPMYLGIADPSVTLALLRYRHAQLSQAKHNARQQGLPGALYPMVTFDGIECHNEWEITFEEIHRNGAIAYAIFTYTTSTGDRTYLETEGVEVLAEIARFWAGRVHFSQRAGMYMIHGVTGPNEYENNVNNNWYTNYLAAWVLRYTRETCLSVSADKLAELGVTAAELDRWADISQNLYLPSDQELGIAVQHDTFLDKDLMPASRLEAADRPLNQHWSWDRILRSCFIKQADVLQGMYFFSDDFDVDTIRRNFDFYEPMTVHESSLSASVHAVLAARIGRQAKAVELSQRTARLDLDNYNNDTEDGLHITSMSGAWLAIVQGFAGVRPSGDRLRLDPFCPEGWDGYAFTFRYRGSLLHVDVTPNETAVALVSGGPIEIAIGSNDWHSIEDALVIAR